MSVRKKVAALMLALLLSFFAAGCSLSPRLARAAVEMNKIESFHTDMEMRLGLSMTMVGQSSEIELLVEESLDVRRKPLTLYSETKTDVLGQTKTVLAYLMPVADGENYRLYLSADSGRTWDKNELESSDLNAYSGYGSMIDQIALLAKAAKSFEETGRETVDGMSAIRYEGMIEGELVTELLKDTGVVSTLAEVLGVETEEESLRIEGGVPASVWLAADSGRILRYDMDLTEAVNAVWAEILEQAAQDEALAILDNLGLDLTVSEAKVSAKLSRFNEIGEIILPAGVK